MPTYRAVLQEIIPSHAIAEAERRHYWQTADNDGTYWCDDGMCALGVMLFSSTQNAAAPKFPLPTNFAGAYGDQSPTVRRRHLALETIWRANDRGLFATPGSLTALLDRPLKVTVR